MFRSQLKNHEMVGVFCTVLYKYSSKDHFWKKRKRKVPKWTYFCGIFRSFVLDFLANLFFSKPFVLRFFAQLWSKLSASGFFRSISKNESENLDENKVLKTCHFFYPFTYSTTPLPPAPLHLFPLPLPPPLHISILPTSFPFLPVALLPFLPSPHFHFTSTSIPFPHSFSSLFYIFFNLSLNKQPHNTIP